MGTISIIAFVFLGVVIGWLGTTAINSESKIAKLTERITELEKAAPKHLPNGYTDRVMDLLANLNYSEIDQVAALERTRTTQKMASSILDVNKRGK